MHVLLVGSGGREHALANLLNRSPRLQQLSVAPGNAGTAAHNVELDIDDHAAVVEWCQSEAVGLVVIGPEAPLVAGLADALQAAGIHCFGPTAAAARLEGSKSFTREFADRWAIPQPIARTFVDTADAIAWLDEIDFEVVVKADGLAAGKGVIIPESREETVAAISSMLDDRRFGDAGAEIVLEERLRGEELSLFGISDGTTVVPLLTAQDHKRVGEGDTGLNTGGMGAFAPVPGISAAECDDMVEVFLQRAIDGMADEGSPFVGTLFAGIMLTDDGPKLIEYNCRFGDPEAEVLLPLLNADGVELFAAAADGRLGEVELSMSAQTAATVVVAADGYPSAPRKGVPVIIPPMAEDVIVHHAGTALDGGELVSSGGRVLAVTGLGDDLDTALARAYRVVDQIIGDGLFARSDIGWRHATPIGVDP